MWEYKLIYIKYRLFQELVDELNKYGADNWDIVHYQEEKPEKYNSEYNAKILLKRPKTNPA
jgi:hypothetical protein